MCVDLKEGVFVHAFITEAVVRSNREVPSEGTVDARGGGHSNHPNDVTTTSSDQ